MSASEVTQLLTRWESRLRDLGASCVGHLRPGLTRDEIDAVAAERVTCLSNDVAALWMWHDGDTGADAHQRGLTPTGRFPDLRGAFDHALWLQRSTCDGDDDGNYTDEGPADELFFRRDYLTVLVAPSPLYVDCTPGTSGTETGLFYSHDNVRAPRIPLVERLRLWHDALDRGIWRVAADGAWAVDPERIPDSPQRWSIYV